MIHPKYFPSHIYKYTPNASTVEIFLDFNCPFSAKMFIKLQDEILPLLKEKKVEDKFNLIFINVVQPWHGVQSSILHDVSFAVSKVRPDLFWKFSRILFDNISKFYDNMIFNKTRNEITNEIIDLFKAIENVKIDDVEKIKDLMIVQGFNDLANPNNNGNKLAPDSKYFARYQRTLGIHVTPSIVLNGIYLNTIESSTDSTKIVDILINSL
jgi:protein-disulfide isomerase